MGFELYFLISCPFHPSLSFLRNGKSQLKSMTYNLTKNLVHSPRLRSELKPSAIKLHFLTNFRAFVKSGRQCPLKLQLKLLSTTFSAKLLENWPKLQNFVTKLPRTKQQRIKISFKFLKASWLEEKTMPLKIGIIAHNFIKLS